MARYRSQVPKGKPHGCSIDSAVRESTVSLVLETPRSESDLVVSMSLSQGSVPILEHVARALEKDA